MQQSMEGIIDFCRVQPGKKLRLADHDPSWAGDQSMPKAKRKKLAESLLTEDVSALAKAQELLYASDTWSILLVFQALDAAGKDSTIKHVMSGINPQGCQVHSFKQPSSEELDHNFLWRCMRALPERGRIGIFNRSYYEEVLVVRVHPELIAAQRLPKAKVNKQFWEQRYEDINHFEQHLVRNGTVILKFFLNVSKQEQRKRFLERLNNPEKYWKFSHADLVERDYWDKYQEAYEQALGATSTKWAPWYVIPADHKWVTRALVATILTRTLESLEMRFPEIPPGKLDDIEHARKVLEAED